VRESTGSEKEMRKSRFDELFGTREKEEKYRRKKCV